MWKDDLALFQRIVAESPDTLETAFARHNLCLVYKMKGLKNEARREFEMVLELSPNNPKAYQAIMELKQVLFLSIMIVNSLDNLSLYMIKKSGDNFYETLCASQKL